MRLVRAWPQQLRADRARVEDHAERTTVDDYNYGKLAELDDDVLLLDWDIAVHREDVEAFASRARTAPTSVLVAPYTIYPDTRPGLRHGMWPMRRFEGTSLRYVETGEPTCHLFGFGMTYLPSPLIKGFVESNPALNLDDTNFAQWHYLNVTREVSITWDIRPVHLNYRIDTIPL